MSKVAIWSAVLQWTNGSHYGIFHTVHKCLHIDIRICPTRRRLLGLDITQYNDCQVNGSLYSVHCMGFVAFIICRTVIVKYYGSVMIETGYNNLASPWTMKTGYCTSDKLSSNRQVTTRYLNTRYRNISYAINMEFLREDFSQTILSVMPALVNDVWLVNNTTTENCVLLFVIWSIQHTKSKICGYSLAFR